MLLLSILNLSFKTVFSSCLNLFINTTSFPSFVIKRLSDVLLGVGHEAAVVVVVVSMLGSSCFQDDAETCGLG